MDIEADIVQRSMGIFKSIRAQSGNALSDYLKILPDSTLQGMAQHLLRQYFKEQPERKHEMDEEHRALMAAALSREVLNECIKKARQKKSGKDIDLDGAELFYRRALNHMAAERFSDAERMLKRALEICPEFFDGWDLIAELYDCTGKAELAQKARDNLKKLKRN